MFTAVLILISETPVFPSKKKKINSSCQIFVSGLGLLFGPDEPTLNRQTVRNKFTIKNIFNEMMILSSQKGSTFPHGHAPCLNIKKHKTFLWVL